MILYTRLMLDILKRKAGNEEDLLKELEKLPTALGGFYAKRLNEIGDKAFARKIFRWLVTCQRPPTVDALHSVDTISRATSDYIKMDSQNSAKGIEKHQFEYHLKECLPLVEVLYDN